MIIDLRNFEEKLNIKWYEKYHKSFIELLELAKEIDAQWWITLLIWWAVRDIIMWLIPKDFDIEIHKLDAQKIEKITSKFGKISKVWKQFWILKLSIKNWVDIDISLPRRDSKKWVWHKWFDIEIDIDMWIKDACRRRDFTMNSVSLDIVTWEIFDYFNWVKDIKKRILKITDKKTFADDPLRVMRAIQFISRFWLKIDSDSIPIIKSMLPTLKELPKERIWEEWRKILLKSEKPSVGLNMALKLWVLRILHEELSILDNIEQDKKWHPEWNVWTHTMLVLDKASEICIREKLSEEDSLIIILASLCHDLWKATTTKVIKWRITSHDHEQEWVKPAKKFLKSIDIPNNLIQKIIPLIANHLAPVVFYKSDIDWIKISDWAIRRLAKRLYPATIKELTFIAEADFRWRWVKKEKYLAWKWLLNRASRLQVESNKPINIISWKELMNLWFQPWPKIWELINYANKLRDDEELNKDEILNKISLDK